jgi:PhnB protein
MLVDENDKYPQLQSPQTLTVSPIQLYSYTEDAEALFEQAIAAGATVMMPPAETADGEKRGGLVDPFGFTWWIATKIRDVPLSEMPE